MEMKFDAGRAWRSAITFGLFVVGGLVINAPAKAGPADVLNAIGNAAAGVAAATGEIAVEDEGYFLEGRQYCWYDMGWRGPGYYWCGYADRRGYGWGGPAGWHGWHGRGPGHGGGHGAHGGPGHGPGGHGPAGHGPAHAPAGHAGNAHHK